MNCTSECGMNIVVHVWHSSHFVCAAFLLHVCLPTVFCGWPGHRWHCLKLWQALSVSFCCIVGVLNQELHCCNDQIKPLRDDVIRNQWRWWLTHLNEVPLLTCKQLRQALQMLAGVTMSGSELDWRTAPGMCDAPTTQSWCKILAFKVWSDESSFWTLMI